MAVTKFGIAVSIAIFSIAGDSLLNVAQASPQLIGVTGSTHNRAVTRQITGAIQNRIEQRRVIRSLSKRDSTAGLNSDISSSGLAAGDNGSGMAGWASFSLGDVKDNTAGLAYKSDVNTYTLGIDYPFAANLLGGVSLSYENTDASSSIGTNSSTDTDGYTIAPYIAYQLDDTFSIDGSLGYSWSDIDQSRNNGTITGSTEDDGYFLALNLNALRWFDNFQVAGRLGYLYSKKVQDAFTESNANVVAKSSNKLGQFQVGANLGYYMGNVMPYFSATYEYDHQLTKVAGATNDDSGMVYVIGANIFGSSGISGGLSYSMVDNRSRLDNNTFSANIAVEF